ncbi:nickel-dependent lactate racemase [Candidatus Sumerlaeota bacterium]|nr:nickel-dependent lactate racemase [Candidatus Sumerlaeota bacterium]
MMFINFGKEKIELPQEILDLPYVIVQTDPATMSEPTPIDSLFYQAISSPIHSPAFPEVVKGGKKIAIVVPDITRPAGVSYLLPLIVDELNSLGYTDEQITIFFALGIHRAQTEQEHKDLLGAEIFHRIRHIDHNATAEQSSFVNLGTTNAETPVLINRSLLEHDRIILLGSITYHYFAGFGGGRKLIIPGMASAETCRANHLLVLDEQGNRRPGVLPGNLNTNPVHLDMVEATELVAPHFCFNVILDEHLRVENIIAGHWLHSHLTACQMFLNTHSCEVDSHFDVVVVSAGGFPRDINFIQAHKALEMAFTIVRPGGTILLIAECSDGVGHPEFLNWLDFPSLNELVTVLRQNYQIYGQTAYATLWKASNADVLLYSRLPEATVRKMRIHPINNLSEAVRFIRQKHSTQCRTAIMPYGAHILPILRHPSV